MKPRAEIAAASNAAAALYNQGLAAYKADPTEARHIVLAALHQKYAEAHALASSTRGVTVKGSVVPPLLPYPLPPLSEVEQLVAKVNGDVAAYNQSLARYNANPTPEAYDALALLHQAYSETLAKAISTPGISIKNPVAPMLPPRLPYRSLHRSARACGAPAFGSRCLTPIRTSRQLRGRREPIDSDRRRDFAPRHLFLSEQAREPSAESPIRSRERLRTRPLNDWRSHTLRVARSDSGSCPEPCGEQR